MVKRNNGNGIARQGDVLVVPATFLGSALPESPKPVRPVLAYGEVTGHSHVVVGDTAQCFADEETGLPDYIRASTETPFIHDEHAELPIMKGDNFVYRQKEFVDGAVRNVAD